MTRRSRQIAAAAILGALALWVRAGWIPIERHVFDGHERIYLLAFQGQAVEASTRVYPTLAGLYRLLGQIVSTPDALLGLSIGAGLAGVGAAGIAVGKRHSARAGWITALLLALSPPHAFWSSSAYNVILPQALLVGACALTGWRGAALYALACTGRAELALLAPAVAVLAGWRVALGALGTAVVLPLLETAPGLQSVLVTIPVNLGLTEYLGPLGTPLGLILVALATTRASLPWIVAALWTHAVATPFDDYGTRHALFGGFALAAALAVSIPRVWHWRTGLVVAALLLEARGVQQVATWYYAPQETFDQTLEDLPPPPPCTEILDDPLDPRSHWNARKEWPPGPVCWGEERIHRAWTSRGLQDRALRMHKTYTLTPVGLMHLAGGPRLIYEVAP